MYTLLTPVEHGVFFSTGDLNSDRKTEQLFHSDIAGTVRLTGITSSDPDDAVFYALTFGNDRSRSCYSVSFAAAM